MSDKNAALTKQLEEEEIRANALAEKHDAQVESVENFEKEVEDRCNQIKLLESTSQSNIDTISGLKEELTAANEKADKAKERFEEIRARAKKTLESEQDKSAALDRAQKELSTAQNVSEDTSKLATENAELEAALAKLRSRNEAIEGELKGEQAKGTKSTLAKQLADALAENESAQQDTLDLRAELDRVNERLESVVAQRDERQRVHIEFDEIEAKQRLGDMLLETNVITKEQLEEVLRERSEGVDHGRIGQAFVDKGFASEDVICQALAHQMDIPYLRIERETVQDSALRLMSERLAEKNTCMPIRLDDGKLVLAMQNPMDIIAIEDVERISELTVEPVMSTGSNIIEAIAQHYQSNT